MTMIADARKRSPWREPMVWLITAIPAASVIAGIGLLVIAIRAGGSDAIPDEVRRMSQIQTADLSADARAAQMKLGAVLRSDKQGLQLLPTQGEFVRDQPLRVALHHPARAVRDRDVQLQPDATGWQANEPVDLSHDWNVELQPVDGQWRLLGRWKANEQAVYLTPALGEE